MKISGTAVLNAPVEQVWAAFTDPAVLARTIPGCQMLQQVGPDAYKMTVKVGVASVKGTYEGDIVLTQQDPPGSFALKVVGAGAPGTVGADVLFQLQESASGGTDLSYEADAVVGGVIGGVGQRMLMGVAKKMASQFFADIDADIAGIPVPAAVKDEVRGRVRAGIPAGVRTGVPVGVRVGVASRGRPAFQGDGIQNDGIQNDGIQDDRVQRDGIQNIQNKDFLYGALTGAAIAIAGVAVGLAAGKR
jgi:carbon monoxide dehydrogenase subunit G